jgi:hypothetical protein
VPDIDYVAWLDELAQKGKAIQEVGASETLSVPQFRGWTAAVEHFLIELLHAEHVYYLRFVEATDYTSYTTAPYPFHRAGGLQVLISLRQDLVSGRLISLRRLVTAEVFSDFMDMAEHLIEHGYKDPAASLIGGVLERSLRDLAAANDLTVRDRDDLTALANRLAEKNVYNRLMQKQLNVWIAVRNSADHGKFEEYALLDVQNMHSGVTAFLAQCL